MVYARDFGEMLKPLIQLSIGLGRLGLELNALNVMCLVFAVKRRNLDSLTLMYSLAGCNSCI